jgi:hypothetical protein
MSRKRINLKARVWDELFQNLKSEWKAMWRERFDDKVIAEGVAVQDYSLLSLGRGTVIVATRKYKAPDFLGILEEQCKLLGIEKSSGYENPSLGGWGKFARNHFGDHSRSRRGRVFAPMEMRFTDNLQKKKGGRGWIHRF